MFFLVVGAAVVGFLFFFFFFGFAFVVFVLVVSTGGAVELLPRAQFEDSVQNIVVSTHLLAAAAAALAAFAAFFCPLVSFC